MHSILLESGAPFLKNCSTWKIGPPDTASSRSRNQCRTTRNQTLISIKQRKKEETYTSPTSMLLVNNYFTKPAVFNIFVVKYNPVSQSTKLAFCIRLCLTLTGQQRPISVNLI